MIPITHFDRGDVITFTASPEDADGNPIDPATVRLYINFLGANGREDAAPISLAENTDGTWDGQWDTSGIGAKQGKVDWAIRTTGPDAASQGSFMLDVNLANPD